MSEEVEAEMIDQDQVQEVDATTKILLDLMVTAEVEISLSMDDDFPVAEAMKMRGAILTGREMMVMGMNDLMAAGMSDDVRLRYVFGLWTKGGTAFCDQSVEAIEDWLAEREMPICSLYPVESSNIAALGWVGSPDGEPVAICEFKGGTLYEYIGVPESMFQEWWNAESHGVYLAQEIKGVFEFRRLV